MLSNIPTTSVGELNERYPVLLLDAYGVLISGGEALPGAVELISHLNQIDKPFFILTNDASRLPSTSSTRLKGIGLDITAERIVSSGCLIKPYFAAHGLAGARCVVLGTDDSRQMVNDAGGEVIDVTIAEEVDVAVVCDEDGYDLLASLDALLTLLFRSIDRGSAPTLVLPNPDLIYPAGGGRFGITAGSIAVILESALALRYPQRPELVFDRLGKPHATIFEEARRRAGTGDLVMIGDQLDTDIRGANDFGIDSVLVLTGLTTTGGASQILPSFTLRSLLPFD
jgi:HAD superfamily hydrolase (TIGR01450 family)